MWIVFVFLTLLFLGLAARRVFAAYQRGNVVHLRAAIPWLVLTAVTIALGSSFTQIDAGNVGVVKRFGQPVRQLDPGVHLVLPFAESVTDISVQTRIVKPSEEAASHDLQVVHTEVTLAYHVDPAYATYILVSLNDDAETRVITPATLEAIKSVTARFDAQQLISERPAVRDGIENFVKQRLAAYHIVAENVSITNFKFSDEYDRAIEAKVVAAQNAEKAQNDLTRIRIEADQQIAQAKGEAEALRAQKEQITPELLQLRTIEMMKEKWDGHLPETMVGGSGALPMMDVLSRTRQSGVSGK